MKRRIHIAVFLSAFVFILGCSDDGDNSGEGGGAANNGSDGSADSNGSGGGTGSSAGTPTSVEDLDTEDICYEVDQGISETISNVMLLQDISSSMNHC